MEEPLHAHYIPLILSFQRRIDRIDPISLFFLRNCFYKMKKFRECYVLLSSSLYPALSPAGSFSDGTGLDDFACMLPGSLCSIFFRTQAGTRNIFMTCALCDDVTDSGNTCE